MLDQGSVSSFLKNNGLTGNAFIDSVIITTAVPFLISYVTILSAMVIKFTKIVGQMIIGTISNMLKERFGGKELCIIKVFQQDTLFEFFKEHIFVNKVSSDQIAKSFFEGIGNVMKHEYDYKKVHKEYKKKRQNLINIDLDYSLDTDNKFTYQAGSYFYGEKELKYFKYNNYVISICLKKASNDECIKIKLYNTLNEDVKKTEAVKILETFFSTRFNLQQYVKYSFSITFRSYSKQFANMINNTILNGRSYLLTIGDGQIDNIIDNKENTSYSLQLYSSTLNSTKSYKEEMKLSPCNKEQNLKSNSNEKGLNYYYKKYINKSGHSPADYMGYFWHNQDIFLITIYQGTVSLNIISPNILTTDDIKDRLDWLLKKVAKNQQSKNKSSSKKNIMVNKYVKEGAGYYWQGTNISKRSFDTIYLPSKTKANIIAEIDNFFTKEKLYKTYQIPYKKGMLFYGPPGTGKTSLVKTIAYEYQINIYIININDETVTDESIQDIINSISGDSIKILLFEDIDSAFADKEKLLHEEKIVISQVESAKKEITIFPKKEPTDPKKEEKDNKLDIPSMQESKTVPDRKYLTYSGLLNALDGVMSSQSGIITIMTTNNIHKLGSALIRPGRIDTKHELKECNDEQIFAMIRTFVNLYIEVQSENKEFKVDEYIPENYEVKVEQFVQQLLQGNEFSHLKPCDLQFYILKYIENVDDIFDNIGELFKSK